MSFWVRRYRVRRDHCIIGAWFYFETQRNRSFLICDLSIATSMIGHHDVYAMGTYEGDG